MQQDTRQLIFNRSFFRKEQCDHRRRRTEREIIKERTWLEQFSTQTSLFLRH